MSTRHVAGARLAEKLTTEFGQSIPVSDIRRKPSGEPFVRRGRCELSLGGDGRLWVTLRHAGVLHVGVREDGRTIWLAAMSLAWPACN
jgi:hypothetical protein